jgi:hypothetical protein
LPDKILSRTLYNRLYKCYYYLEKDNYIKYIDILFTKLLKNHSDNFLKSFTEYFSSTAYTGIRYIYKADREVYKNTCLTCAINIDKFLTNNKLTNIYDTVIYKSRIQCNIGGILENKNINVHFSFRTLEEMQKELAFYSTNNYIYNILKNKSNDCLIFNVQSNTFYLIKNNDIAYTITNRGYLKTITKSRNKTPGEHCHSCKNTCKPMFINGLDRLNSLI